MTTGPLEQHRRVAKPLLEASQESAGFLERVQADLGETVTIMPGVDLTEPLWDWVDEGDLV